MSSFRPQLPELPNAARVLEVLGGDHPLTDAQVAELDALTREWSHDDLGAFKAALGAQADWMRAQIDEVKTVGCPRPTDEW